jgi:hypothetical protein
VRLLRLLIGGLRDSSSVLALLGGYLDCINPFQFRLPYVNNVALSAVLNVHCIYKEGYSNVAKLPLVY